jgi:hypothetical protein
MWQQPVVDRKIDDTFQYRIKSLELRAGALTVGSIFPGTAMSWARNCQFGAPLGFIAL